MKNCFVYAVILVLAGCKKSGDLFHNPSPRETGIDFANSITENDELNILDYLYFYNGGGVAIGDINNDGLPDIYLSGNQVKNKLYLNKGGLNFEDITEQAGVGGQSSWNTGSVMADVNGDGLLDIYVCAVVGTNGFVGYNELFINNGNLTFSEQAGLYGLDFESYSSSAAFLDYDLDGDLDMYLLNHAVHTSESYGKADLRYRRNYETGDRLLKNDNGKFVDVSEEAGIYGGVNGYGLGVAISDFNMDGYPDIYVGNDFHEDDYYYLNNGDGTFTESLRRYFGHTSRFSMGNDVADINHDGLPDLISLDMLPEEEVVLKSSEGDENLQVQKLRIDDFGYHYQFTRNMLYVNQPDGNYMETALMSGVAATDWSWSALFGDYDQDGHQDLFVANGIPKRPNNLDFIKFVSNEQIQQKINNTNLMDQEALELMPSGTTRNFIFKGDGKLSFDDKSAHWISNDTLVSGATAYGDLDNDGDLDLVVNNLNSPALIYENKTNDKANYLKVRLDYNSKNRYGIGSKIYAYYNGSLQLKELFLSRGFQASSEPLVHFGLGEINVLDSLKIVWPDRSHQTIPKVRANQTLMVSPRDTKPFGTKGPITKSNPMFTKDTSRLGINFTHKEDNYLDFNREKLIPYRISDRGPAFAMGDLNSDGKADLFFGGSKFFPGTFYKQLDSSFVKMELPRIQKDSVTENIAVAIADFNADGANDIIVGNGGGDFYNEAQPLQDRYYLSKEDGFQAKDFPKIFQNTSVIEPFDYDQDGDLDVFVGGHTITAKFGEEVNSYVLTNTQGTFEINKGFQFSGMVTDAIWDDFDQDGNTDLIIVGEWMSPRFFQNKNGTFVETNVLTNSGLWQSIHPFDIDGDGDRDYLLGNWGLNSKFKASKKHPLRLYFSDFDGNGQTETITAFEKDGKYYTLEGLDGLASQMVSLRKKFNSYQSFAGKSIEELFDPKQLQSAKIHEVTTLASGYLKNNKGAFEFVPFPNVMQVAPLLDFVSGDFDGDGQEEVLVGGNYFGVKPYHGRFDSFPGALIQNENEIVLGNLLGLDFTQKSIRHMETLTVNRQDYLLAVFNNGAAEVYKINSK
ncbi:VCBS repeat-containing protein [Muricauda sp. SCSIO 64092]|uniref:VCBS repeat-containing protein n=1 Tax=Allomuricauda sp. SCSIO 64092 TaxID=2908842 RepID=UPI001FF66AE1|nr:VCBS repeat-containing protein [Muricauda sp. SCSIO 64092]UOY04824.1 VCBS repeat-containing protein [Muricauda sp. SCSIO 64092]